MSWIHPFSVSHILRALLSNADDLTWSWNMEQRWLQEHELVGWESALEVLQSAHGMVCFGKAASPAPDDPILPFHGRIGLH